MRKNFIKYIFLIMGCIFCFFSFSYAEKVMYLSGIDEVAVRRGAGLEYKIIYIPRSEEAVDVLNFKTRWSKIRLKSGLTGWVLTRHLTDDVSDYVKLAGLSERYKKIEEELKNLIRENKKLNEHNAELKKTLVIGEDELKKAKELNFAEFLILKDKYEKSIAELNRQIGENEVLAEKISAAEYARPLIWFIAGASVLLLGFITGYFTKHKGRKGY